MKGSLSMKRRKTTTIPRRAKGPSGRKAGNGNWTDFSTEDRLKAVHAFQKSGMTAPEFAAAWGISVASIRRWVKVCDEGGEDALRKLASAGGRPKGSAKRIPRPVRDAVVETKTRFPFFGVPRIRDWCARFMGIGVSRRAVEKTLAEAQLKSDPPRRKPKARTIRRFERAKPMQMWQSDITQFVCPRTEKRVFLCVFLDDCTRYVTGWAVNAAQTADLVLAAYEAGVTKYGRPQEALTDQGRQYVSWRGTTEFQRKLKQDGVKHVISRSHHPETLGKCERLWKTVQEELWARVEIVGVEDAKERLEHWFGHYNFFRPHQGLDGATPADRFFGVEEAMRKVIEETVAKNAEMLALEERPRQPFYLTAQVGERQLAVAADRGGLIVATGDETVRMPYEDLGEAITKVVKPTAVAEVPGEPFIVPPPEFEEGTTEGLGVEEEAADEHE